MFDSRSPLFVEFTTTLFRAQGIALANSKNKMTEAAIINCDNVGLPSTDTVMAMLEDKGLVLLRGLGLTPPRLAGIARAWFGGRPMLRYDHTPADPLNDGDPHAPKSHVAGHPCIRKLGNTKYGLLADIGYEWHMDSAEDYTILYCHSTPEHGAETLFADSAALFEGDLRARACTRIHTYTPHSRAYTRT